MPDVIPGPWKVRCAKVAKSTGQQCSLWAIRGSSVCQVHGGGGSGIRPPGEHRNARTAAADRLNELRSKMLDLGPLAVTTVTEVMRGGEVEIAGQRVPLPPAEPKDRLKAAQMVLDRLIPTKVDLDAGSVAEHRDIDAEIEAELELLRHQRDEAAG